LLTAQQVALVDGVVTGLAKGGNVAVISLD
jgi:hypothetical protein